MSMKRVIGPTLAQNQEAIFEELRHGRTVYLYPKHETNPLYSITLRRTGIRMQSLWVSEWPHWSPPKRVKANIKALGKAFEQINDTRLGQGKGLTDYGAVIDPSTDIEVVSPD